MELQNRVVLVTGGSSGLGAACVQLFAERGAAVVAADLQPSAAGLPTAEVLYYPTDVTDETSVLAAIAVCRERFGGLHGVVHCAGVIDGELLVGRDTCASLARFRRVIEVNLIGTFNVLRLAAQAMKENATDPDGERGVIVLTSSVAAFEGQIGQSAYAASKGGVASMTLPAARELARYGIRVVAIAPGVFETPMMSQVRDDYRESLREQIPFPPRFGRPEEFAALAGHVFDNRMLNGCVLRLDGALRMGPR